MGLISWWGYPAMSAGIGVINRPLKRKVAIRRDGEEFLSQSNRTTLLSFGMQKQGRCERPVFSFDGKL